MEINEFVLLRILQTIGAYGFRGFYEKKGHFIQSMPLALNNLNKLLLSNKLAVKLPYLNKLITKAIDHPTLKIESISSDKLTVRISSFSYKKTGIPVEYNEHGGGFVFDCRTLPNPYKEEKLRNFTGKDKEIINFFKDKPEIEVFFRNIFGIIDQSINNYKDRGFINLSVSFGCTGGQHRSVYCAEKLKDYLKQKEHINVELNHLEEKTWNILL